MKLHTYQTEGHPRASDLIAIKSGDSILMGFANAGRLEPLWICEVQPENEAERSLLKVANCTGLFCSWLSKADVEARASRYLATQLQELRRTLREAYGKARQLEAAAELQPREQTDGNP